MKYIALLLAFAGFLMANGALNAGVAMAKKGNYVEAFSLFNKACEEGDANGCLGVGLMYMYAIGTNGDTKKAMYFYKKACSGGNALACSNLGSIYDVGVDIPQDKAMANELYMVGCNGCLLYTSDAADDCWSV